MSNITLLCKLHTLKKRRSKPREGVEGTLKFYRKLIICRSVGVSLHTEPESLNSPKFIKIKIKIFFHSISPLFKCLVCQRVARGTQGLKALVKVLSVQYSSYEEEKKSQSQWVLVLPDVVLSTETQVVTVSLLTSSILIS